MAKRENFNKGAGHYSQNDVKLYRPRNVDDIGNVKDRPRDHSRAAESMTGMGTSRAITKSPAKRYGP